MFQSPSGLGQCDWLQFSVRLGGQQCGSNYNARIQYILLKEHLPASVIQVPFIPCIQMNMTQNWDRKIYDKWFGYDQQLYCSPGIMVNPDIGIVAGSVPTFYGEVESSTSKESATLDKLDQVSARVLCYTDKCFSIYAQSDKIHFKFYQRDDRCGTVYVKKHAYQHSPVSAIHGQKELHNAIFWSTHGE